MKNSQNLSKILDMLSLLHSGDTITVTENNLKTIRRLSNILSYSVETYVSEYVRYTGYGDGGAAFEICPKCKRAIGRTYQTYCSECGQKLKWISTKKMTEKR